MARIARMLAVGVLLDREPGLGGLPAYLDADLSRLSSRGLGLLRTRSTRVTPGTVDGPPDRGSALARLLARELSQGLLERHPQLGDGAETSRPGLS